MIFQRVENQNLNQNILILFDYYEEPIFFDYFINQLIELIEFLKLKKITIHCVPIFQNSSENQKDNFPEALQEKFEKYISTIWLKSIEDIKNHLNHKEEIGIINPNLLNNTNFIKLYENFVIDSYSFFTKKDNTIINQMEKNSISISKKIYDSFTILEQIINPIKKPKIAILGGTKITETIQFIDKNVKHFQYMCLGGTIGITALKANGLQVGNSIYDKSEISNIFQVMNKANYEECEVALPIDHIITDKISQKAKTKASLKEIHSEMIAIDIGTKTIDAYEEITSKASTVFFHGPMGVIELEKAQKGTYSLLKLIQKQKKSAIICGHSLCEYTIKNSMGLRIIPDFEFVLNYMNHKFTNFKL